MQMKNGGYSLTELIVVLAIISALLAIAGISGKAWINKYQVEQLTQELYVDMLNARSLAMQRTRVHFLVLSSSGYILYEDTYTSPDGDGDLQITQDREIMRKTNKTAYPIDWNQSATIAFDTRGLITVSRSVWIATDFSSATNCIAVSTTRILTGAWNGSDCITQ